MPHALTLLRATGDRLDQAARTTRCRLVGHDPVQITRHSLTWCHHCGTDLPDRVGRVLYRDTRSTAR